MSAGNVTLCSVFYVNHYTPQSPLIHRLYVEVGPSHPFLLQLCCFCDDKLYWTP